jgi:hypothetical protein
MLQDLDNSGDPFYRSFRVDKFGRVGLCIEVKVLLVPLRALVYDDAPHCFCCNYHVSPSMARKCYRHFLVSIQRVYGDEYMRTPRNCH